MASERRFQVFVSSTYRDLKAERDKILRTLAEFNYIPAGMEFFPAIDEEQFKFIKRVIDESDYYVVIISGLYGSLATDGKSYTEKEYEYALENKKPICVLLRQDISGLPIELLESNPQKISQLEAFRTKLSASRLVSYWQDENDLCLKLVKSLAVTSKTYPAQGWVRGGDEEPIELLKKIQSLESENTKLKERISSIEEEKLTISAEMETFLTGKVVISYQYWFNNSKTNTTIDATWGLLAEIVLPKCTAPYQAGGLRSILESWIAGTTNRSDVKLKTEFVDTVKVTLGAFNLLNYFSAEAVGGGAREFMQITELGTRVLTLLKLRKSGLA